MKSRRVSSDVVLSRGQWVAWFGFTVTSLVLGAFGFLFSIQRPSAATDEFEDRSLIRAWGTTEPGSTGFRLTVNPRPLLKYKNDFYVVAICRAADPSVDSRSDNRIDSSNRFEIRGETVNIQTTVSQATMQRLQPSGWVQVFVLLVPKAVEVSEIQTIGQVERIGGRVLGVRGALVHTTVQK